MAKDRTNAEALERACASSCAFRPRADELKAPGGLAIFKTLKEIS